MTPGELYSQGTNVEDQVDQLGVMTMLRLDIKHSLFGVKKKADLEDDFSDLKEVLNQTGEELSESGSGEEPKKPVDTSPNVMDIDKKKNWEIAHEVTYRQLSLFDDDKQTFVVS